MNDIQEKIRQTAKQLLESGEINYFIGWGETRFPGKTMPKFIFQTQDTDKLVFNEYCRNALASYLLDDKYPTAKIGLCVRGCDSRAVNRLINDKQIARESLHLVGIPCLGMKESTGEVCSKCEKCTHPTPVTYDVILGEEQGTKEVDRFADVRQLESFTSEERYAFWVKEYDKCIRCYACRNICPACSCAECYVDQYRTGWQGKQTNRIENQIYGMTRAFHVGDRCVECGACEEACPMDIPLMLLNRKLIKDISEMFGDYESGLKSEGAPALGTYLKEDLDEFM